MKGSSCLSIRLRQEELAFIKAISTLQLSPELLRELKMAMSQRNKKAAVSAGSHGTTSGGGTKALHRPPIQFAGNRKANELARSGDSSEPANRRPAPGAASSPLFASASAVASEQAVSCSRKLLSPKGRVTYAVALAGSVAPFQPSGSLKSTAMGGDPSEPAVSSETAERRMCSDMFGPLSDKIDGTSSNAQVTNICLAAGERPNKSTIFI